MGAEQDKLIGCEITEERNDNFKMCYKLVTGGEVISNDDFSSDEINLLLTLFDSFKTSKPIKFKNLN